jgi:hypothetical protein
MYDSPCDSKPRRRLEGRYHKLSLGESILTSPSSPLWIVEFQAGDILFVLLAAAQFDHVAVRVADEQ